MTGKVLLNCIMQYMDITSEQVCQDVILLMQRFKQEIAQLADESHLTSAQLGALYMLDQHGELAMGEVAHVLHCDPSNVTGIVDRLVAHELVRRKERATDRRAKTIALTTEGKKVVDTVNGLLPQRLGCAGLTSAERKALHDAAQKLVR